MIILAAIALLTLCAFAIIGFAAIYVILVKRAEDKESGKLNK